MRTRFVIALTLFVSAAAHGDDRRFSAADLPAAARLSKTGRVVISNDANAITAQRISGKAREVLVTLRTVRRAATNAAAPAVVPARYLSIVNEAAQAHGVDASLIAAVIRRESAWNATAVSPVGASGLMQLMPATARSLGVTDVFDARQNIFGGARYLRELLDTYSGNLDLTLAAYNAGPGAVRKYNGVPPYRETREYVKAVLASYEQR